MSHILVTFDLSTSLGVKDNDVIGVRRDFGQGVLMSGGGTPRRT
jgi:hypothetical protein